MPLWTLAWWSSPGLWLSLHQGARARGLFPGGFQAVPLLGAPGPGAIPLKLSPRLPGGDGQQWACWGWREVAAPEETLTSRLRAPRRPSPRALSRAAAALGGFTRPLVLLSDESCNSPVGVLAPQTLSGNRIMRSPFRRRGPWQGPLCVLSLRSTELELLGSKPLVAVWPWTGYLTSLCLIISSAEPAWTDQGGGSLDNLSS